MDNNVIVIIVSVGLASMLFMAGFHNIDLAWNMSNAPDCMDYNGHIYQSKDGLYRSGTLMQFLAVVWILLTVMFTSEAFGKRVKT